MARGADLELTEELPADPASASRARRLLRNALTGAGREELVDVATLLVSEVVTNAVLHAGTTIQLRCCHRNSVVRVEVSDGSKILPSVRHYDPEATTGRGLALVSTLADAWGLELDEGGKTLWFELADAPSGDPSASGMSRDGDAAPGAPVAEGVGIHLLAASPALVQATIQYGDAVLRELALLALGGELDDALPDGWHLPQIDITCILEAAAEAESAARVKADLVVTFEPSVEGEALERMRLIDHADQLARSGRTLSPPALPEIGACRHWMYSQIAEQLRGAPAEPWELPEALEPSQVAAVLTEEDLEHLEQLDEPTVVADDANRIIFVNEAAADLLGWDADALCGRRLTTIIPPELREAHLAGFSRLKVTGETRILGTTVVVPALRRDGTTLEVGLTIESRPGADGRTLFAAALAPA